MERLSGLDAGFLYLETKTVFMHTLKLVLVGAAASGSDVRAALIHGAERGLRRVPQLRRRLLEVPFGLHHPLWVDAGPIDLKRHVRSISVPPPGGFAEVARVVAELAGTPLDRARPLWELWVLEGYSGGVAVVLKIHHALADGAAATELLSVVTSTLPYSEPFPDLEDAALGHTEPIASQLGLVRAALRARARDLTALPALLGRTTSGVGAWLWPPGRFKGPRPILDVPRTSFNGALTAARSVAMLSLPLDRAMAVKQAADVTLNDVLLALVSAGLRRYLMGRAELPHRSLVASVPVAWGSSEEHRKSGNRVSSMFVGLATDEQDPWARLQAIHRATREAKAIQAVFGTKLLSDWLQYALPRPFSWVIDQWSTQRLADRVPPSVNVVVSNIRGPSEPLYAGPHPLHAIYSFGPILEGIGLNVTMWSYLGRLHITLLACRAMVPDPFRLARAFATALTELEACATARGHNVTSSEAPREASI